VLRVSTDGGEAVSMVEGVSFNPMAVSPDGTQLLGSGWDQPNRRSSLALLPTGGGEVRLLNLPVVGRASWSADSKSVIYLDFIDGQPAMMTRDLSQTTSRELAPLAGQRVQAFAWSWDGQKVALGRGTFASDDVNMSRK
jgi:hypothetical protein